MKSILLALILVAGLQVPAPPPPPDLAVINGKIVIVESIINPEIVLDAPSVAEIGDLIILKANTDPSVPKYGKQSRFTWKVNKDGKPAVHWSDGDQVIFGAGARSAVFDYVVEAEFDFEVDGKIFTLYKSNGGTIQVGNPTPPDPPKPPLSEIAQKVKVLVEALVTSPNKAKGASIYATQMRLASKNVFNGSLKEFLSKVYKDNTDALNKSGIDPKDFDAFGNQMQEIISTKYKNKEIQTVDDFKRLFGEIADGLEAVR